MLKLGSPRFPIIMKTALFLIPLFLVAAEPTTSADDKPAQALKPQAYLGTGDISFAHVAVGGVWRTSFFLVNMSQRPIPYTLRFYDDGGFPMPLPIGGDLISSFSGTLEANGENNFTATNADPLHVQQGQAVLSYDHSLGQIGGY